MTGNVDDHTRQQHDKTRPPSNYTLDVCRKCREVILGAHVATTEHKYHSDCFRCFHCLQPFKDDVFFETDAGFFCEEDHALLNLYSVDDLILERGVAIVRR